jgi:hypothetical protein
MKKSGITLFVLALVACISLYVNRRYYIPKSRLQNAKKITRIISSEIHSGDIIFQTSLSRQSSAIQLATHSEWSHCGIIYKKGNEFYVLEAIQPVKSTLLDRWIAKGKDSRFVIKRVERFQEIELLPEIKDRVIEEGRKFIGKDYDLYFGWSDDKIYCSELVWKMYKRGAGIELGKPQLLKDFDLSNEVVKAKMKERYGTKLPLNDTVISPISIFNSDLLVTVAGNNIPSR